MLEMANGHAPFAKFPPMKVLLMTLQNPPPSLENKGGCHHFSKVRGAGGLCNSPSLLSTRMPRFQIHTCSRCQPGAPDPRTLPGPLLTPACLPAVPSPPQHMRDVVARCLQKDPTMRPTATELLQHRFFKVQRRCSPLLPPWAHWARRPVGATGCNH
jgi:serine/threonine protein kinase